MRRCSPRHPCCWPGHADLVDTYRAARTAAEQALEQATAMYEAEVREYLERNPLITFKDWLIQSAGRVEQRTV